jgi:hypothetical protein
MAALIDVNTIVPPVSQIISDQLINYVNTVKDESITDVDVGSKMWTFMYSSGIQKVNLYYKLYQFKKQSFVLYATGKHLDLHGQERGVFRLQANYSEGLATFYRAQPSPIELKISQGVEVTTTSESADEDVITFVTTEPGVIPANQLSVEVPIVCTIPGTSGNLPSSALNRMPTPPAGVHRVITTSTTGGTEQETDEDYRSRIIVALESLGKGTLSAITNAVRSVQGVRTVTIYDPTQILVGANYYLIDTNNIKCTKLETLNATIANNSVKLYIRNSETEANTKVLKIWSIDKYDVETLETFDNINDFEELVERINSTKKKYVLMNNGRPILELFTIQPEGSPLNEVYMEIVDPNITENYKYMNSPYVGLRYIFRVGNDIRNTEKYENIENIGQLVNTLNNSKILSGNNLIAWEESLPIQLYANNDEEQNFVIPTYQPVYNIIGSRVDSDENYYKLEWVDDGDPIDETQGQKIVVYTDTGDAKVNYIYNTASFIPTLINGRFFCKFFNNGSNLVKASIYGEKINTNDSRKVYDIMEDNKFKIPKNIGAYVGELGEPMVVIKENKPGSITVLPVPHALPMSVQLRENIEKAIDEVKAAGIDVIIEEPKVEFVDISIAVGLNLDVGADETAIKEQIAENLTNYINALEQNEPAYWERLIAQANPDIEGLLYTEVISPSTDILPPSGGFLRAGEINFGV